MRKIVGKSILDLTMPDNDASAETIRDYLKSLLKKAWIEGEGFDGKRPFGNSGWQEEVYAVLLDNDLIEGEEGLPDDETTAEELILMAINVM